MKGTAFGRALRDARRKKGWTRLQAYTNSLRIADCPITPDSLEKWEAGQKLMSIERVVVLAMMYEDQNIIEIRLNEIAETIKNAPRLLVTAEAR